MRSILTLLAVAFCIFAFVEGIFNKGFLRFRGDLLLDRRGNLDQDEKLATSYAFILKVPSVASILRVTFVCNGCQEELMLPVRSGGIPAIAAVKVENVQRSGTANGQGSIKGSVEGSVEGSVQANVKANAQRNVYEGTTVDLLDVDIKRSFRNIKQFVIVSDDYPPEWYLETNEGKNRNGQLVADGKKVTGHFVIKPSWRRKYWWWSRARSFCIVIDFGKDIHDPQGMAQRITATYELVRSGV